MNARLAALFNRIALLLELKGESAYKIRAYRRAAETLATLEQPVTDLWQAGRLTDLPGIGKAIADKIDEYLRTGHLAFLERLEEEVPSTLLEVLAIPGLGPKKVRRLWQDLGITTVDDLEAAARAGRLRALSGFGAKTEARLLEAIARQRALPRGFLLGEVYPLAQHLQARLETALSGARISLAGSVRRGKALVGDLDLLLSAEAPEDALRGALGILDAADTPIIQRTGYWEAEITLADGLPVHLIAAAPQRFGTSWVLATGSEAHRTALQTLAASRGMAIEAPFPTEQAFYAALGLTWIPPELREGRGEVEAAAAGRLPDLVTTEHMRADLHSHTTWSDGHAEIREMAEAAAARGLHLLAITDHSQSLGVAHGLTVERLRAQREEIRRVQAEMGERIVLLQGAEVEILADGRLDYPDEVLAELDIVVAALHTGLGQPREQVTARLLAAIRNPHVDIIAHPSGRLLPHRAGADLDWEAVLQAAARHGVALEINAHPRRLDLTDEIAHHALRRGILLAVDTDAHRPTDFDNRFYGVVTARRAWATEADILNTRSPQEILAWLQSRGA